MGSKTNRIGLSVLFLLTALAVQPPVSRAESQDGAVSVFVQDTLGNPIPNALVYISRGKKQNVLESSEKGTAATDLAEGNYSITASLTQADADYVERLASPEAHVMVHSQDTTSVILTLYPVRDQVPDLSLSALKKLGIAEEVSKYTNN